MLTQINQCQKAMPCTIKTSLKFMAVASLLSFSIASFVAARDKQDETPGFAAFYSLIGLSCLSLAAIVYFFPPQRPQHALMPMLSAATLTLSGYAFMVAIDGLSSLSAFGYPAGLVLLLLGAMGFWAGSVKLNRDQHALLVNTDCLSFSLPFRVQFAIRAAAILTLFIGACLAFNSANKAAEASGIAAFYSLIGLSCLLLAITLCRVPLQAPSYALMPTLSSATASLAAVALTEALYNLDPASQGLGWVCTVGLFTLSGLGFGQGNRAITVYKAEATLPTSRTRLLEPTRVAGLLMPGATHSAAESPIATTNPIAHEP